MSGTMAQNVVGGDDVHAVVVDIGSHVTRIGSAGDDSPRVVLASYAGVCSEEGGNKFVDGKAEERKDAKETSDREKMMVVKDNKEDKTSMSNVKGEGLKGRKRSLIGGDDILVRPTGFDDIVPMFGGNVDDGSLQHHLNVDVLSSVMRSGLGTLDLLGTEGGRPILVVEPCVGLEKGDREKVLEMLFGEFGASAAFIARGAAMAAFAAARTTATVVEAGHWSALAVPVVEGYVLQKCVKRRDLGGRVLTDELEKVVEGKLRNGAMEVEGENMDSRIRSWHEIRKKKKNDANGNLTVGNSNVRGELWDVTDLSKTPEFAKFSAAHRMYYRTRVVEDMKMGVLRVPSEQSESAKDENAEDSKVTYELPDGNILDLDEEGKRIGSMLFEDGGIPQLAYDAVTACDMDVRRDLYSGVVVTGGTTNIKGFHERFTKELAILTPQMFKLKVMATPTSVEKSAGPWIGGSIVASLGTFQQNWISKAEFDEQGALRALRKCP